MTDKTSEKRLSEATQILRSLRDSVCRVRQQAEILMENLQEGEFSSLERMREQIVAIEGLIRICQKTEISLVEHLEKDAGGQRTGQFLNLEDARAEVESRLARIYAERGLGDISE
ncbi:hypothetical protein [Phaeobacter sp. 22II1-1F12B]|uniref:hypothetical protein n=1 Tax=Phaeobacter sp. 22II1-1F12B TaxID=1317111 RepID=UPI000B523FEC|nr:hypothetical protein [Phaeobacter sp. 22II1-1F12B]OWU81463.1 hypothetical protein ATO1_05590 [Phaeobacter sp. 22II1-1F12B]